MRVRLRWLALAGGLMIAAAIAVVVVRLDDGDADAGRAPGAARSDDPDPPATDIVQESTTTEPDEAPASTDTQNTPVTVAVVRSGRLELLTPGEAPVTLVDDLDGRTVQAVAPDGEVLLSPGERWFESVQIVGRTGAVTEIDLGTRGALLNTESALVELMLQPDDDELGDLVRLDLATGVLDTVAEDVILLSQNLLPIARAGGVVVDEYSWIDEYQLLVTDAAGTPLPSPTDGRYGVAHGVRSACPGAADPLVDAVGTPVLDEDGRRLAWLNRVVGGADDGPGVGEVVRTDVRVLRLSDGADGSVAVDPDLGALVALRGEWAVLEGGFVSIASGEAIELGDDELVVAAFTAPSSDTARLPSSPIPAPACPDGGLSIYGLRDLRVGRPAPTGALADWWERAPRCWVFTTDNGGVAVHLDEQGAVLGVVVSEFLEATPSGIRQGTRAEDVVARLGERIEVSPAGADPVAAEALDFVPSDPAEANLGLRFVIRDGRVGEMWAGDRAFTRSGETCLL